MTNCDARNKQIEVLFGVSNPILDKHFESNDDELGVALRAPFDHETYRTGGFVWVTSQPGFSWTEHPLFLKHLILHEFGHAFGMRHDSVFVMNSKVADDLQTRAKLPPNELNDTVNGFYGMIESPTWPYKFRQGSVVDFTFNRGGFFGIPIGFEDNSAIPSELRSLLGISNSGSHQVRLVMSPKKKVSLVIAAASGTEWKMDGTFNMSTVNMSPEGSSGPGIFTGWQTGSSDLWWGRLAFDFNGSYLPKEGYFEHSGNRFAATLTSERGIQLKLFLPHSGSWWVLK